MIRFGADGTQIKPGPQSVQRFDTQGRRREAEQPADSPEAVAEHLALRDELAALGGEQVIMGRAPTDRYAGARPSVRLSCCRFRGHEDKIVTKETEIGHGETEVHEGVQV